MLLLENTNNLLKMKRLLFVLTFFVINLEFTNTALFIPKMENTVEDAIMKWERMEKSTKEKLESGIKQILPMVNSESEVNVSTKCTKDILKVIFGVRDMKLWAIELVDSMGKPSAGILNGAPSTFGDYEQCLDVKFPGKGQTKGQHCWIKIATPLPPKTGKIQQNVNIFQEYNHTFDTELFNFYAIQASSLYSGLTQVAICVPSTCTKTDLQNIIDNIFKDGEVSGILSDCDIKEPKVIDSTQWAIIIIFAIILLLNLSGAIYDIVCSLCKIEKKSSALNSLLSCFSPVSNMRRVMDLTPKSEKTFECLNGIKSITISWIILCHSFITGKFIFFRGLSQVVRSREDFLIQVGYNGFPSVDSFFLMTGVLMSYQLIKHLDEKGPRSFNVVILLIRRIWRLLPSALFMVGVIIIIPLLGSGPIWMGTMGPHAQNCRERWWTIPSFISNFYLLADSCIAQGWYLSVEMQSFLVAMVYFVLVVKLRNSIWSRTYLAFLFFGSMAACGIATYVLDLNPTNLLVKYDARSLQEEMRFLYLQMYSHIGNYAIGIAMGHYLVKNPNVKIPKKYLVLGWLVAIPSALAIIYGIFPWTAYGIPTTLESVIYATLHRNAWGLCFAWVIFVCATGHGGIINDMLSWSGFKPFSRISYLMYLNHVVILASFYAARKGHIDYDYFTIIWCFFSALVASTLAGIGAMVSFELPVSHLEIKFLSWLMSGVRKIDKVETIKIENVKKNSKDISLVLN